MKKTLLLVFLVGCAADSYVLREKELLPYKESSQITKLNQESKTLTISAILDERKTKEIGFAYTGVEYKKTPVYLESGLSGLMQSQISAALQMRNIEVIPNGEVNLVVAVKELSVHEVIEKMKPERASCKLGLEFSIDHNNAKWSGSYWTEFTSAGDMSDGTERLAPTMASCINELVEKLITDAKFTQMLRKE